MYNDNCSCCSKRTLDHIVGVVKMMKITNRSCVQLGLRDACLHYHGDMVLMI